MVVVDPREGAAAEAGSFWTFEAVEARLVEAMLCWWRMPDRERGWQRVKAAWPEIQRFPWRQNVGGETDEREEDPQPRRPALTRGEIEETGEASEWLRHVADRDRKLVAMVLACLAGGAKAAPWLDIWDRLGRGRPGPEGLRKRYSRAITKIAQELSR